MVLSPDTAISVPVTAANSLKARFLFSALVICANFLPFIAALPTLDATPTPGTTYWVITSAPFPTIPSGSKPAASRRASAPAVTLSP